MPNRQLPTDAAGHILKSYGSWIQSYNALDSVDGDH
jgi:hypothetical protein